MEPVDPSLVPRYRLILGKFPVVEIKAGHAAVKQFVSIDIGNKVYLTFDVPINADVQLGDQLTLFTEVLVNAQRN